MPRLGWRLGEYDRVGVNETAADGFRTMLGYWGRIAFMKFALVPFLLGLPLLMSHAVEPNKKEAVVRLFNIQRIENANELIYEARMTPNGFTEKDPIKVYWVMKAKDGSITPLNAIEKQRAYGVAVEKSNEAEIVFTLKAFKGRKIVVRRSGAAGAYTATAFTLINDVETQLDRLYITTSSLGLIPVVAKVDIYGKPKPNGEVEQETFVP